MICDTSGLLAALFGDQRDHFACASALRAATTRRITTAVLTEVYQVIAREVSQESANVAMRQLLGPGYEVVGITGTEVARAVQLAELAAGLEIGMVQVLNLVTMKRLKDEQLLTVNRSPYQVLGSQTGTRFVLIPSI